MAARIAVALSGVGKHVHPSTRANESGGRDHHGPRPPTPGRGGPGLPNGGPGSAAFVGQYGGMAPLSLARCALMLFKDIRKDQR